MHLIAVHTSFTLIAFRLQVFLSILPGWRPLGLLFPIFNHQGFFNVHTCTRDLRVYRPSPIGLGTDPACRHLGESHMRSCEHYLELSYTIKISHDRCVPTPMLPRWPFKWYFYEDEIFAPKPGFVPGSSGLAVRRVHHSATVSPIGLQFGVIM